MRDYLWSLTTKAPIPEWLALSRAARIVERFLTHDYYLQRLATYYIPVTTINLLDIGCGGAAYLKDVNYNVIGIDYNPKRLVVARKYCNTVLQRDIAMGLDGIKAETVLCLEVIEHLYKLDGEMLLKEFEKYPCIILSTPRYFFRVNRKDKEKHVSYWSEEELKEYGFRKIEEVDQPPSNIYIRNSNKG